MTHNASHSFSWSHLTAAGILPKDLNDMDNLIPIIDPDNRFFERAPRREEEEEAA